MTSVEASDFFQFTKGHSNSTPSSMASDDDLFALDQSSSVQTSVHDDVLTKQFYSGPSFNHSSLNSKGHANFVRSSMVVSPSFTSELAASVASEVPTRGMTPSPSMQALESLISRKQPQGLATLAEEPSRLANQSQISLNTFYTAVSQDTYTQQPEESTAAAQLAVGPNPATEDLISLSSASPQPVPQTLLNQMTPSLFSPGMTGNPVQGVEFLNPASFGPVMGGGYQREDSGIISIISADDEPFGDEPRRYGGGDMDTLNSAEGETAEPMHGTGSQLQTESHFHTESQYQSQPVQQYRSLLEPQVKTQAHTVASQSSFEPRSQSRPQTQSQTQSQAQSQTQPQTRSHPQRPVSGPTIRAVDNEDVIQDSSSASLRPIDATKPEPEVSLEKELPPKPQTPAQTPAHTPRLAQNTPEMPQTTPSELPAAPKHVRSNSSFSLNWSSKTRKQKGMSMPVNKLEDRESKQRKRRSFIGFFKKEKTEPKEEKQARRSNTMPSPALSTGSQSSFGHSKSKSTTDLGEKKKFGWKRRSVTTLAEPEREKTETKPRRRSLLETYGFDGTGAASQSPALSTIVPSPVTNVQTFEPTVETPTIHEPAANKPVVQRNHSEETTVINEQMATVYPLSKPESTVETPQKQVLAPPFDPRKAGLGISFDAYRFDETPESEPPKQLQHPNLSPRSPSKRYLHTGDALFPKSLDQDEVQSITTLERSRSLRSVVSSPVDRMLAHDLDSVVNDDGMLIVRSPQRPSRVSLSPKRSPEPRLNNDTGLMDYLDFISFGDVDLSTDFHIQGEMDDIASFKPPRIADDNTIFTPEISRDLGLVPQPVLAPPAETPAEESYPSPSISDDLVSRNAELLATLGTPDIDQSEPVSPAALPSPTFQSSAFQSPTASPADTFVPANPRPISSSFRGLRGPAFGNQPAVKRDSLVSVSSMPSPELQDPFESRESLLDSPELTHHKNASVSSFVQTFTRHKTASMSAIKVPKQSKKALIRKRQSKSVDMIGSSATVRFSSRIVLYNTYDSEDYDRRPEIATCNQLTPQLAQQIKDELNELKSEMEVHEQSRCYTHFF